MTQVVPVVLVEALAVGSSCNMICRIAPAVVLSIQIVHVQARKPVVSVELMLCRYDGCKVYIYLFFFCFFFGGFLLSPFWLVAAFFVGCFLFLVANVIHEENGVVKSSRFYVCT